MTHISASDLVTKFENILELESFVELELFDEKTGGRK
jgi:hypothetical protein